MLKISALQVSMLVDDLAIEISSLCHYLHYFIHIKVCLIVNSNIKEGKFKDFIVNHIIHVSLS